MGILYLLAILLATALILSILIAIVAFVAPAYVPLLVNKKQKLGESEKPYFFTYISPGTVKVIIRGKTPIRYLMNFPGHSLLPDPDPQNGEGRKYNVIPDSNATEDKLIHMIIPKPSDDSSIFAKLYYKWQIYVFNSTKAVFTGIWPFQKVYTYELPRTEIEVDQKEGKRSFIRENDLSDHVNVKLFTWYFDAHKVEIAGKLPVRVKGSLILKIINPYFALFRNKSWSVAVDEATLAQVRAVFKALTIDDVLGGVIEDESGIQTPKIKLTGKGLYKIGNEIKKISKKVQGLKDQGLEELYGVEVIAVQITDIDPEVEAGELRILYGPTLAAQEAKSETTRGRGRAAYLQQIAKIIKEYGNYGELVQRYEAQISTAEAGNATVIFGQSGQNQMESALFAQLQALNVSFDDLKDAVATTKSEEGS